MTLSNSIKQGLEHYLPERSNPLGDINNFSLNIVTLTMNDTSGLLETFQSIYSAIPKVRWIVINGGAKLDDRVRSTILRHGSTVLLEEADEGISDAFNKGMRLVNDGWVWFLNSGDKAVNPAELVLSLSKQEESDRTWLSFDVGSLNYVFRSGSLASSKRRLHNARVPHQGQIYHTSLIRGVFFDKSLRFRMDLDFHYQLISLGALPFHCPQLICDYEGGGLTETRWFSMIIEGFRVDIKHAAGIGGRTLATLHLLKSLATSARKLLR